MSRRLTQTQIDAIRDAYNEWAVNKYQPGNETIDQLAERVGVSKVTIYALKRRGWSYANRKPVGERARLMQAETEIHRLTTELSELRLRFNELERRLEQIQPFG